MSVVMIIESEVCLEEICRFRDKAMFCKNSMSFISGVKNRFDEGVRYGDEKLFIIVLLFVLVRVEGISIA